jgi:hypothetical protein
MPLFLASRKVKITRLTSGTAQTHTYDPDCTWALRKIRGPGGGGSGSGTGTSGGTGGTGTATTLGGMTANSGAGANDLVPGAGGTASGGDINVTGQDGQTNYGFGITYNWGGMGGGPYAAKSAYGEHAGQVGLANTGSGGMGGGAGGVSVLMGAGGGEGGYAEGTIANPGTETYTVGAPGAAGTAGTSGYAGAAGTAGDIWIYEYFS